MGWIHENETCMHEASLAPVFEDGAMSGGSTMTDADGIHRPDLSFELVYTEAGVEERRPSAQVVGWVLRCDCYEHARRRERWVDPQRWVRVPSQSLEDLARFRIFADDLDASFPGDRDEVAHAAMRRWEQEHLTPLDVDDEIRAAVAARRAADAQLDAAVVRARKIGRSWAKIGAAAGMTAQSANERWRASASRHGDD